MAFALGAHLPPETAEATTRLVARPTKPPQPAPGTLPAGSTRTNPLPTSPTAPALFEVDPVVIDPTKDSVLNIVGRNLSAQTVVQVDVTLATILDVPDPWHLIVRIPGGLLKDGSHDIIMRNPNGELDDARGVLMARTPGPPVAVFILAGVAIAVLALYRVFRWLTG